MNRDISSIFFNDIQYPTLQSSAVWCEIGKTWIRVKLFAHDHIVYLPFTVMLSQYWLIVTVIQMIYVFEDTSFKFFSVQPMLDSISRKKDSE